MAESSTKVLEGVFAVSKPPHLSSAQVLRDLQNKFATSRTFAPLLQETRRKEEEQERHQPRRRKRSYGNDNVFKMGHGGTLDPLATGVLIVGIGKGTKHLNTFLECTKTYDTVVLFGKSTDTYDSAGKVVVTAPFRHVTKDLVEDKLANFRGQIKQVPPIYSALKIQGMKAYEYARSGKELPRQLESRDMNVEECSLLEWYEGGKHDFRWPAEEASEEDKAAAQKLMQGARQTIETKGAEHTPSPTDKTHENSLTAVEPSEPAANGSKNEKQRPMSPATKSALHTHHLPEQSASPSDAPAARIRLTVSSGFYVRSLAHDLGVACDSYGIMVELLRSRQADFTTLEPVPEGLIQCLTYEDLEKEEDHWGPKITRVLQSWMDSHPDPPTNQRQDDRDSNRRGRKGWTNGRGNFHKRRRNSSSPELSS